MRLVRVLRCSATDSVSESFTDASGLVYISDSFFSNVQVFNRQGEMILQIGDQAIRPGVGSFALIAGVAVDECSNVLVLDQYFKKLEIFRKLHPEETKKVLSEY